MPVPPSRDHVERVAGARERDRVRLGLAADPAVGRAHLRELLRRGRVRHVVEEEVFVPGHHQVAVEHGRLIEVSPAEQRRRDQALLPLRLLQVRRRRRLRRVLDRSGRLLEGGRSAGAGAGRPRGAAATAGAAGRAAATTGTRRAGRARRAPPAVRSRGRPSRARPPAPPVAPPPVVPETPPPPAVDATGVARAALAAAAGDDDATLPAVDPPVVPAAPLVEPAVPGPAPEPLPADPLTPPPVPPLLDPPLPEPLPGSDPAHAPSTAARETVSRHASTKGKPGALTLCMGTSWVGGTVPTKRRAVHATSKNGSHVPPQFPPGRPLARCVSSGVSHFWR